MFTRLLSLTRYSIIIPVVGAWVAALISLGIGAYEIILTVTNFFAKTIDPEKIVKLSIINLVEAVDLFLLGTAFYLISLGLYELFIDENASVPHWLVIHDLDDLKSKLISIIIVILGVQFLAQVLNGKGDASLLPFGAAVAVVIFALSFFIGVKSKKNSTTLPSDQD
jgi:uncharacterized membrane protein YqhA